MYTQAQNTSPTVCSSTKKNLLCAQAQRAAPTLCSSTESSTYYMLKHRKQDLLCAHCQVWLARCSEQPVLKLEGKQNYLWLSESQQWETICKQSIKTELCGSSRVDKLRSFWMLVRTGAPGGPLSSGSRNIKKDNYYSGVLASFFKRWLSDTQHGTEILLHVSTQEVHVHKRPRQAATWC